MSENVQKVQTLYEAFGRGDINTILDNLSDGVTWGVIAGTTDVPWHPMRNGRDGVAEFFTILNREVEFTEFAPKIFAGAGENVFVQLDIAYRLKKNGATVKTSAVHHFVLDGGRVVSFREYEDTESVVKAWNA